MSGGDKMDDAFLEAFTLVRNGKATTVAEIIRERDRLKTGLELAAKYLIELHEKNKAPDTYMVEEVILARRKT